MANRKSFGDILKARGDVDDSNMTGEEKYAGGIDGRGGGSGLAVLDPPSGGGKGPRDIMDRLTQAASQSRPDQLDAEAATTSITLYANGFIVDDGPLRATDDPTNKKFMEDLLNGVLPDELKHKRKPGAPKNMNINLADKRHETFTPPAYSGEGHSLGGGAKGDGGDGVFTSAQLEDVIAPEFIDEQPSTTLQVKTSSGKKLRLKANLDITVVQLASLIRQEQGEDCPASFTLSAGFPPMNLDQIAMKIEDAGLKGASVVQKRI